MWCKNDHFPDFLADSEAVALVDEIALQPIRCHIDPDVRGIDAAKTDVRKFTNEVVRRLEKLAPSAKVA